ncbi:hypothetical protein JOF56_009561 [Kibdelosporangium banguiense]|uniref:DUF6292 domain-containing protein n=1 Tax=Kibdelosporangium banguiense TaxID=1365924 RepID=A0ABS4TXQ2_9PSEU|nr:DUF6292 family protein [Kibdelosporangium banguiense]MBP2329176.1 hypothetical protein [Kibdelosporangium banguiense]
MSPQTDIHDGADMAEYGLRNYVHRIANALGVGPESTYAELADEATAYIALSDRLFRHPSRDVALTWDGSHGWAVGMETRCGEDLLMLAWYGSDMVPAPENVVAFTKSVLAGEPVGQSAPPTADATAVRDRLGAYLAPHTGEPAGSPRTNGGVEDGGRTPVA